MPRSRKLVIIAGATMILFGSWVVVQADMGPVSITQSLVPDTLVDGTSVAEEAGGMTQATRYLRLYDLDGEFRIVGDFCVTSVDYGCERAVGGPEGTQPLTVRTHCLDDGLPFLTEFIELRDEVTVAQPDCELEFFNETIGGCCDADTQSLVVEIATTDCFDTGLCVNYWVGMNDLGQTAPTYIACPHMIDPVDLASIGYPNAHLVEVVNGIGEQQGNGDVPATTGIGSMLIVLMLLGGSAYFLRRRATN